MSLKVVSGLMLTLLLVSILFVVFDMPVVVASGTIYIRADGSIDPPTAPIQRNGDIYTLTSNITSDADGIIVERDNIVLDGAEYTLQGTGVYESKGIYLYRRNNVTIKNMTIRAFYSGIRLDSSSSNIISENNVTSNNYHGIFFYPYSDNNFVFGNTIANNSAYGFCLQDSDNNTISGNTVDNSTYGIALVSSELTRSNNIASGNVVDDNFYGITLYAYSGITVDGNNIKNNYAGIRTYVAPSNFFTNNNVTYNIQGITLDSSWNITLFGNTVANNNVGLYLRAASGNTFYNNNFIGNSVQVSPWNDGYESTCLWDNGYPSGGNYWSDYVGNDTYSGPYQNETGSDGIGDTPYVINAGNVDHYPLMNPWIPYKPAPVGGVYVPANKLELLAPYVGSTILLAVAVITVAYVKKRKKHTKVIS